MTEQEQPRQWSWKGIFHAQDFAWVLFVVILLVTEPERNYDALILVPLIGAFQVIEPRLQLFRSRKGQVVSIVLKLALSYFLVAYTDGIFTYYYSIFLIPVVSAATTFEIAGVIAVTVIAAALYFSLALPIFVDWNRMPPDYLSLMSVHVSFYAIVAFLVYWQAKGKREEMARTEEALARLVESNRTLQQTQISLRRTERLAALGQLTAGLAHELRNPLGTIKASAEMLTKPIAQSQPEVMAEMAGYIGTEVDRMNGLISSFLDFARPLRIKPAMNVLKPVIEEVVRAQAELASQRRVGIKTEYDDPNLTFSFDPEVLRVAISNLVQNALEASDPGQTVEVRVSPLNDLVRIIVSDHGEGIRPEHLENIYNPFFTTKSAGVGLGLALVSKVVDEHHGRMHVFSEPGRGTIFELTLPQEQAL